MSTDSKDFFERVLNVLQNSQSNFDLIRCVPESINKPNDMAYLTKNTEGIRSRAQDNILEDFQDRSRLNRERRQLIGLMGDSIVRTFAETPEQTITSADAIIAQLEEAQRKVCSSLELKFSEYLADSLYGSHLERISSGCMSFPMKKEKLHVHQGVLEFSVSFDYYDEFVRQRKATPAVKRAPKLKVGDEVTWEFWVEGIRERTASIAIKYLSENSFLLRDSFVVDGLDIRQQNPYTKVGKVVLVRRADVVNGGHKIVYSNG